MIVNNHEVTLERKGYGFPEEAGDKAMTMWNCIGKAPVSNSRQHWETVGRRLLICERLLGSQRYVISIVELEDS